jgi:hypothetical protein
MAGEPEAQDALHGLVSHYASLRSYSDCGRVTRQRGSAEPKLCVLFSTFYQQPLFRFHFRRPHPYPPPPDSPLTHHAVGFDGRAAYQMKRDQDGAVAMQAADSIETAVARATGISHGSSHTIAQLLVPGIGGISYLELLEVRLKRISGLEGVDCFVLSAEHPSRMAQYELWIERERLLLRKQITHHASFLSEELRSDIRINEPIESGVFSSVEAPVAGGARVARSPVAFDTGHVAQAGGCRLP